MQETARKVDASSSKHMIEYGVHATQQYNIAHIIDLGRTPLYARNVPPVENTCMSNVGYPAGIIAVLPSSISSEILSLSARGEHVRVTRCTP